MISFLIAVLKIVFILGFLVFIHEGGHFLVAKLCKIKVIEFAIGFGPTIWSKQGKETKYALRLIPLGGFVNMVGEEERSYEEGSFSNASIPKRIAVVVAGGAVNIIFALIVYFILMSSMGNNISTTVDHPIEQTGAAISGLQSGDKIIKINGKTIHNKNDLDKALEKCNGENLNVIIKREKEELELTFFPREKQYNYTGISIMLSKQANTKIASIDKNSPAQNQGLKINDIILKINDVDVKDNAQKLVEEINKTKKEEIKFTIDRNGEEIDVLVMPEIHSNYYLGVYLEKAENNLGNNLYYAFWKTGDFAFSIVDNLKLIFTGNVSIDQMMGPVGIGGVVAETSSFKDFIYILALVSISLGFTNLLPFPPLDGGKAIILLLEAIRRKPMKQKTEVTIQMVGFIILIGLSLLVTYNDILRVAINR